MPRQERQPARSVVVRTPYSPAVGEHALRWDRETDVRPLRARPEVHGLRDDAVAAYVAKYVTKGASEAAAGADRRLSSWDDIDAVPVTPHPRTLMRSCWRIGGLAEFESLRLRSWAHALGFRGHVLTKSRAHSATYAALRAERAAQRGTTMHPARSRTPPGAMSVPVCLPMPSSLPRESPTTCLAVARSLVRCCGSVARAYDGCSGWPALGLDR
ncbi:replication initiator [Streptomyces lydicus]|uniref:replication initiator n=1 Tax=Streptomyces lydicus TaxID=47763 RepID=UPI002E3131CC|nr:replication initiator [Streptomyces lydicus]